jgi:hypothetical protein
MATAEFEPNDPQNVQLNDPAFEGKNGRASIIRYPLDIEHIDHWMVFRVQNHVLMRKDDYPIKDDRVRIFLPVPNNLGTQYGHAYETESLGVAGAAGGKFKVTSATGALNSLLDEVKSGIADPSKYSASAAYYGLQAAEENLGALVGAAVGGSVGGTIGSIASGLAGAAAGQFIKGAIAGNGIARNPYMAVIYKSPNLRQHQFEWKFIPRSKDESIALKKMIQAFKYYAAPGMSPQNEHFFTYPEQFDIDFHYQDYLYNIGPSVLSDINVNYHGEGQPMYFNISDDPNSPDTKAPASVTLSMTFQEVSIIDKSTMKRNNR